MPLGHILKWFQWFDKDFIPKYDQNSILNSNVSVFNDFHLWEYALYILCQFGDSILINNTILFIDDILSFY